jgi:hypothetical protein
MDSRVLVPLRCLPATVLLVPGPAHICSRTAATTHFQVRIPW